MGKLLQFRQIHSSNQANNQSELLLQLKETQYKLEEKNKQLELINQIGIMLTSELELEKVVQKVTDIATELSKAKFGALFYKKVNAEGEEHTLYTLSGADKKHFQGMHTLRNTPLLAPTFNGEGVIRSEDITRDPRYGQNKPHQGMPTNHLFLRSYLALPVISKSGEVLGGLFFGHPEAGVFTQYEEDLLLGIAAQAAVAIDNARLFEANVEAEQRTKRVLESIPQMAWTCSPDGKISYYNKRWYDYTGQLPAPGKWEGWQEVVHPADLEQTQATWQQALKAGVTFEIENRLKRAADNSYRWHLVRGTAIKDKEGQVSLWVGTCTDVQDFKLAEQDLIQKNQELIKINADLDSFVYTASHDLKSPVINIQQIIQELHAGAQFHTEGAAVLQTLLDRSIEELQRTIQDLSEIVEAQKSQSEVLENINLAQLIDEVLISLKVQVSDMKAQVVYHLEQVPLIPFSRSGLKSILYNLINNSLKYRSTDRIPNIEIQSSLEANYIKLSISDNGMGMDLENRQHKLFQMFTRFHDHVPGSGIGLYIVNRIIRNHGGFIEVESKRGEGTTFNLFFKRTPEM